MSLRDEFDEYIGYIDNDINNFRDNASQNLDLFENKFHYISAGAIYLIISVFLGGDKCFHVPIPHLAVLFFGIPFAFLQIGLLLNIVLGFLPAQVTSSFQPLIRFVLTDPGANFAWLVMPVVFLIAFGRFVSHRHE
jgi:hypothetical protein